MEPKNEDVVHSVLLYIVCALSFLADLIMIVVFYRNRKIKTRANSMFQSWAMNDAVYSITATLVVWIVLEKIGLFPKDETAACLITQLDGAFQLSSVMFMLIFSVDKLMLSKKLSDTIFLVISYGVVIFITILNAVLCGTRTAYHILEYASIVQILALFLTTVITDLIALCRKTTPSDKMRRRNAVGRIFSYNSFACWIIEIVTFAITDQKAVSALQFLYLSNYLSSVYIFVYLFVSDVDFKSSVLHLFKTDGDQYCVDDTIGVDGDDDKGTEEGGNDSETLERK